MDHHGSEFFAQTLEFFFAGNILEKNNGAEVLAILVTDRRDKKVSVAVGENKVWDFDHLVCLNGLVDFGAEVEFVGKGRGDVENSGFFFTFEAEEMDGGGVEGDKIVFGVEHENAIGQRIDHGGKLFFFRGEKILKVAQLARGGGGYFVENFGVFFVVKSLFFGGEGNKAGGLVVDR